VPRIASASSHAAITRQLAPSRREPECSRLAANTRENFMSRWAAPRTAWALEPHFGRNHSAAVRVCADALGEVVSAPTADIRAATERIGSEFRDADIAGQATVKPNRHSLARQAEE